MNTARSGVPVNANLNYVYDNIYRLTQATRPLPAQPNETFSYDLLGNRLRRDAQVSDSVIGAGNRLLEDGEFTYQYDANGNLTQKTQKSNGATTRYSYDAEDQLVRVDFPDGTNAQYRYDGLGRRIEKNVSGTITRYVYDGEDILFEFNGTNRLLARYTHGDLIDEPLLMEHDLNANGSFEANERFTYHTDGLGSITDLTDTTGAVTQSYVYDSFGNIVRQNGTLINPYTYTGREFDLESGLFYYRARYYDPRIGRFLSEDPIEYFDSLNLYEYLWGNPINWVDPYGLSVTSPKNYWEVYLRSRLPFVYFPSLALSDLGYEYSSKAREFLADPEARDICITAVTTAATIGVGGGGIIGKAGKFLFGKRGLLNRNPFLRIGEGRHKGRVFRVAGELIKKFGFTKKMRTKGKIDFFRIKEN